MAEVAGKSAIIKVSGTATSLSGEGLTRISNTEWQITTASKRVIDRAVNPTLQRETAPDTWADVEYESVNKLNGKFTFAGSGYDATETIRVKATSPTAKYLPMSAATYAHEFSYSRGIDLMEVNKFGDSYKDRIPGTKFASGTLSQWDVTSDYYKDALTAGNPVVIEFLHETGADPIRVWALLESVEMSAAIANPQDEVVSFISTDELLNN